MLDRNTAEPAGCFPAASQVVARKGTWSTSKRHRICVVGSSSQPARIRKSHVKLGEAEKRFNKNNEAGLEMLRFAISQQEFNPSCNSVFRRISELETHKIPPTTFLPDREFLNNHLPPKETRCGSFRKSPAFGTRHPQRLEQHQGYALQQTAQEGQQLIGIRQFTAENAHTCSEVEAKHKHPETSSLPTCRNLKVELTSGKRLVVSPKYDERQFTWPRKETALFVLFHVVVHFRNFERDVSFRGNLATEAAHRAGKGYLHGILGVIFRTPKMCSQNSSKNNAHLTRPPSQGGKTGKCVGQRTKERNGANSSRSNGSPGVPGTELFTRCVLKWPQKKHKQLEKATAAQDATKPADTTPWFFLQGLGDEEPLDTMSVELQTTAQHLLRCPFYMGGSRAAH